MCEAKGILEENDSEMSRNGSLFILVQLVGLNGLFNEKFLSN